MQILFYVVAAVLFAIAGLTPVFDWNLGEFHVLAWGLTALALGHAVAGGLVNSYSGVRHRDVL